MILFVAVLFELTRTLSWHTSLAEMEFDSLVAALQDFAEVSKLKLILAQCNPINFHSKALVSYLFYEDVEGGVQDKHDPFYCSCLLPISCKEKS